MSIEVTFAEILQAATTISTQSREVDALLDELRQEVTKTLGGYTGQGAEAYQASQAKWDQGADDLNKVLAAIGTAVQQAGEGYQEAEQRNISRW
ncbi:hypothetical protein GCM10022267_58200 [Lentzea roselyniae]|uniref:ESAT-6-like protein n=1 Tax=Lentzea roselyniae TaxID=531940 RepID=A0ABP7BMH8_9PSEU